MAERRAFLNRVLEAPASIHELFLSAPAPKSPVQWMGHDDTAAAIEFGIR